jgi:hypothetical protein
MMLVVAKYEYAITSSWFGITITFVFVKKHLLIAS